MAPLNRHTVPKRRFFVVPHAAQGWASFPKEWGAASLFGMVPRGAHAQRGSLRSQPLALGLVKNRAIEHAGTALDAEHQDIALFLFKLAEGKLPAANFIDLAFSFADALAFLGKGYTASNRHWLRDKLDDMSRHHVQSKDAKTGKTIFSGSLIAWRDAQHQAPGFNARSQLRVSLSAAILTVYENGYGKVDLDKRRRLGSSHLARLMQVELACQPEIHHPYLLSTFQRLFGSQAKPAGFKQQMRGALQRLLEADIIAGWTFQASAKGPTDPLVVIENLPRQPARRAAAAFP